MGGPSEFTGSEKIPRARSMRRTTDAVRRAARISVNGEDLRPGSFRGCRAPLAMVAASTAATFGRSRLEEKKARKTEAVCG